MIDVSCFVGAGPLVPHRFCAPETVAALLRREGVVLAGVSPMAGLFQSDPAVNDVLSGLSAFFRPIPVVDPRWPDVTARLSAYHQRGWPAVRIVPGSHGYRAGAAAALKQTCGSLGLALILQLRIADPRNLPRNLVLDPVDLRDALALTTTAPEVPMVFAGARATELPILLTESPDTVHADLSLAEEPDVLRRAVAAHGARRLLIGTHTPFLTPAAARQKLTAARLTPDDRAAVGQQNAATLGL